MGHPDHRIVSTIVTQLQRAGAPGVPERVFFMYLPAEAIRAMVPQRGEPPLLVPDARFATARVAFSPEDLQAAARSMACHASQFTPRSCSALPRRLRVSGTLDRSHSGVSTAATTNLFR
jgi:LmbE family N-acetylglucosaminyl deacetylase